MMQIHPRGDTTLRSRQTAAQHAKSAGPIIAPPESRKESAPPIGVDVRSVTLIDALAPSLPFAVTPLSFPSVPITRLDPRRIALSRAVPFSREGHHAFMARQAASGRRLGMITFQQIRPDFRWVAHMIGIDPSIDAPSDVVLALLHHAIMAAGSSGARRLYARLGIGDDLADPFRTMGFTPYGRESVFALPAVPPGVGSVSVLAPSQAEVWAIHQLYMRTTPADVHIAEALTSHSWDIEADAAGNHGTRRAWCVMDDYAPVAYVHVTTRPDAHVLDVMYEPGAIAQLRDVVLAAFRALRHQTPRTVCVTLKAWQQEAITLFESLGATALTEQDLFVRYTTAPIRSHLVCVPEPRGERINEPVTKRAPTYCSVPDASESYPRSVVHIRGRRHH